MRRFVRVAPDTLARDWALVALARIAMELVSGECDPEAIEDEVFEVLDDCASFLTGAPAKEAMRILNDLR